MPCGFQALAAHARYLAGYVSKEWEASNAKESAATGKALGVYDMSRLQSGLCLPDMPQQETANDCGFFILVQILLLLQLTPEGLRTLATLPADLLSQLPWPAQRDVTSRKAKLREAIEALFEAADDAGEPDVDALLKKDPELRRKVQCAMWDGPSFSEAVRRLAAASAPRRDYSLSELGQMSTKSLRSLRPSPHPRS